MTPVHRPSGKELLAEAEAFARDLARLGPGAMEDGELRMIIRAELIRAGLAIVSNCRAATGRRDGSPGGLDTESCGRIVDAIRLWLELLRDEGDCDDAQVAALLAEADALATALRARAAGRLIFGVAPETGRPTPGPRAAWSRVAWD